MLKVIASSTCDVCFVEYADDNPPYCIPCGHVSCKSCLDSMIAANNSGAEGSARCAFCRSLFEQSGVRRLHVDLGAVPSEVASSHDSDGSETINGDEDENKSVARSADKMAMAVANATFERNAEKIKSTSAEGQRWIAMQRLTKPGARFPVLTALTQLAVGNMENYNACRLLEQKLLESRANVSQLTDRLQTLEEADQRERQNFEKIRTLEQELDSLRQSLSSTERSLRTTTSSLADATASLAESDTALAAAKAELAAREDVRVERDALKAELEAAQAARDESRSSLSKAKKELSGLKHELKQIRADQDHPAPHTLKNEGMVDNSADMSENCPKKLSRRRSRKLSQSALKTPLADDSTPGLRKLDGARPKKSRHMTADKLEDDDKDSGDQAKPDEPLKSKGHSKDKEKKERGREKHKDKDYGEGKNKDLENQESEPPADPNTSQPSASEAKASGEKPHKSGKRKKAHASAQDAFSPPERSASAPPGTEAETQEALKISTDSLPPSKGESSNTKSPDPKSPPTSGPRRGIVETLSKPGPAMRVLRRAMGRKATSPGAGHDLGSASTVVNMTPGPSTSPAASSSSTPAATNLAPGTSPVADPPLVMPVHTQSGPPFDPLQVPRTVAYTPYPLPNMENIAGFGIPGVVHEMSHAQPFGSYPIPPHADPPRRFQDSATRNRGPSTPEHPLPRPPRSSDEGYERDFVWPYDPAWDQSRTTRGKGRDREDRHDRKHRSGHRHHLSNEWHGEEGVTPVRRYVAAEDVPGLSASSRHMFDNIGYGESPPAYPMYEHGLDSGMPRKSSFANLRGMK